MNEQTPNPGPALPDPGSDPELDDLLGAYALDALDEDEHGRVDAYVSTHRQARLEVSRFENVLAALASAEAAELPPQLWDRVQRQLDPAPTAADPPMPAATPAATPAAVATLAGTAPAAVATPAVTGDELARRRATPRTRRWAAPALAVAAALALLASTAAVTTWANNRGQRDPADMVTLARAAEQSPQAQIATLEGTAGSVRMVLDGSGHGYLLGEALPTLSEDQTYQLWSLDGSVAVSLGVLGPRPSVVAFPAGTLRSVALSIEPRGGRNVPTLPTVAAGQLRPA